MKTTLYNLRGETIGEVEVPDRIFGAEWNADLVHQVRLAQAANRHGKWAHAKDRSEVRGGGRKPWKQKHTGRARHGSIRSPIWRGGGVTHGPDKNRDYSQKLNKKMIRSAIYSVLSRKLADGEVRIVDSLNITSAKTKDLFAALKLFFAGAKNLSATLIPKSDNKTITRASRNIPKVAAINSQSLNAEFLLKHKNVLIDQEAVQEIK